MGTGIGLTFAVLVLVAITVLFIRLWVGYRGKRIVTCPETHLPVGAKINAALAAGTWIVSQPRFVISGCSRWPEREGCDQACVPQIEDAPDETLVKNIVAKWYRDKNCIYCGSSIREINGSAVAPALRGVDGELHEWKDVAPENLPALLQSSVAVCARCELAEDFRRRFPNLVVDRAETPLRNRAIH
jgi:hypothetical protein